MSYLANCSSVSVISPAEALSTSKASAVLSPAGFIAEADAVNAKNIEIVIIVEIILLVIIQRPPFNRNTI
jgi:hypothetical protein